MQNQTEDEQNDERQDENTKTFQKDTYHHTLCLLPYPLGEGRVGVSRFE